jgi:hypothetical protein
MIVVSCVQLTHGNHHDHVVATLPGAQVARSG